MTKNTHDTADYQRKVSDFVSREVYYCASMLISELASNEKYTDDLMPILSQPDYETAADYEGYKVDCRKGEYMYWKAGDFSSMREAIESHDYSTEQEAWQACCENENIDYDYDEALEHWLVSNYLADKLEEAGEMVERDFLGLTIWGRQTSGQAISMDGVITGIYDHLHS